MSFVAPQELIFVVSGVPSGTQYLHLDCEDGRPTACTFQVWPAYADDTSTAESCTTGSAAVETSPNTTLTAAAGPAQSDPTAIALTSGSGVSVGRRYLLTEDGTGANELIEVATVSGLNVTTKQPLLNNYSAGSTFQSTRWSIAMDSTWLADVANLSPNDGPNPSYRVRCVATVNGNQVVYPRGFDLVRYQTNHGVTPQDVDQASPGWFDNLPPDCRVDQGRSLIEQGVNAIRAELAGDNKTLRSVRSPHLLSWVVIKSAERELQRVNVRRGRSTSEGLALAEAEFRQAYDQAFRSPVAAVDTFGGGGAEPVTPRYLTSR
jgi:hypothetical protein